MYLDENKPKPKFSIYGLDTKRIIILIGIIIKEVLLYLYVFK